MESNPFSTKFIQPGAIPFAFCEQSTAPELADVFLRCQPCKMNIVGPHGSGKSSLLAAMIPILSQREPGGDVSLFHYRITQGIQESQPTLRELLSLPRNAILIIDGYEQISLTSHAVVSLKCRWSQLSLLATSHRPIRGLSKLWSTRIDGQIEKAVLHHLLSHFRPEVVEEALNSEAWSDSRRKRGDNLRESLFDMYDWWETRRSRLPGA